MNGGISNEAVRQVYRCDLCDKEESKEVKLTSGRNIEGIDYQLCPKCIENKEVYFMFARLSAQVNGIFAHMHYLKKHIVDNLE